MEAGQLENKPLLMASKRLYRAPKDKGYPNAYEDPKGSHNSVRRREKLSDELRALKHTKPTL